MRPPLFKPNTSIAGINITPIIDVGLVLVIILLITAPLLSRNGPVVDLPRILSPGERELEPIEITVTRGGRVLLDDTPLAPEKLTAGLRDRLAGEAPGRGLVVVRADAAVPHRTVRTILEQVAAAGAPRLAVAIVSGEKRP